MKLKTGLISLLLMCAVVFPFGCGTPVEGTVDSTLAEADPMIFVAPVQASPPRRGDIASYFETTSRIEAQNRVEVLSKGTGQCLRVNAEVGDTVKLGQTLVDLEREELEAQVRQARVSVQQQKTAYEIAERSFNEGIGASAERDNMRFAYEQARATLELSELRLRNQVIQSPIGGIITQRIVQQGMVVSPGMPLFTIVDPTSYTLPINVPEKDLARLQVGQEAEARIDAFPDRVFKTRVSRINPSIDPLSGTVRILLGFDPADRDLLRDAAFARVRLVMDVKRDVLLVPREAIIEEEGRKYLFLLDEVDSSKVDMERFMGVSGNKVYTSHRTEIRTGLEQSDVVEVTEGLDENTLVVTMGHHTLKADAYVTITNMQEQLTLRSSMTPEEALIASQEASNVQVTTEIDSMSELNMEM